MLAAPHIGAWTEETHLIHGPGRHPRAQHRPRGRAGGILRRV